MGLDTTHGCWHGPYTAFNRWRGELHVAIQKQRGAPDPYGRDGWERAVYADDESAWPYSDPTNPIDVLMSHSDCDGEIAAAMCGPLADALESLLSEWPERAMYDGPRPATERFIKGLRLAAERGEAVVFQ